MATVSSVPFSSAYGMLKRNMGDQGMAHFSKLTTNVERILFLLQANKLYDMLQVESTNVFKSTQLSKAHRTDGNKEFQNKNYQTALEFYTKSCFSAPSGDPDHSLALAYSNRSAALFHLEHYEEAINDIDLSLACDFPTGNRHKLYDRRGKCLTKLGRYSDALADFQQATECVEKSNMNDKQKETWLKDIRRNTNLASNKKEATNIKRKEKEIPQFETQERIDGACVNIDLEWHEKRGRDMMTLDAIAVGDSVVLQKPYCCIAYGKTANSHCHHCCKRSFNLLPSELSAEVGFCSEECISNAQPYHSVEYQYLDLLNQKGLEKLGHLALRIALVMDMENKQDLPTGCGNFAYGTNGEDVKNDYVAVANLITNSDKRTAQGHLQLAIMSLFLVKVAEKGGFFGTKDVPREAKIVVGCTILNMIQAVQCNAHAICEHVMNNDFRKCAPRDIGLGLYPTISLLNHSCNPNCELVFYDNICYARASRFIPQGSKLTVDYGVVYYLHTKESRQEMLKQQYFFDCSCEACEGNWLLLEDLPSQSPMFKCSECATPLPKMEAGSDLTQAPCNGCNHVTDLGKVIQELYQFHEMYGRAMERLAEGTANMSSYLPILMKFLMLMDMNICQPLKDYVSCQATIKQCFRLEGSSHWPRD